MTSRRRSARVAVFGVLLAGTAVVAICWVAYEPCQAPLRSLCFTVRPLPSTADCITYSVVISNASTFPIQFYGGVTKPWLEVRFEMDDLWRQDSVKTIDRGFGTLQPHTATAGSIQIPRGATQLQVGLHFTSLTWRGRTAWRLAGGPMREFARLPAGRLLAADERVRSKTEWSNIYHAPYNNAENQQIPAEVSGAAKFPVPDPTEQH